MVRRIGCALTLVLMCCGDLSAQGPGSIEERLVRLEEGQKALVQRFDDFRAEVNQRFDDANRRLDDFRADVKQRLDDLQLWQQLMVAAMAGVLAQGFVLWRHVVRLGTRLEDHLREGPGGRPEPVQGQELDAIRKRLDRLEGSRA